jgi:hypothetical protein
MRRLIAVVAALAVSAGLTLAAVSTAADAGVSARVVKSAAPGLARAVSDAKTTQARVAAIDKIMAVLRIDVINPENGAVVVKGAARSLNDAYLYTSEVEHLALAYAARDRLTFDTLAGELGLVYTKLSMHLTGQNLGAGVEKVIRAESNSSMPDSVGLLARLVWQLGLLDKPAQDLAKKIPVAKVRLDPLQAWLITAEFTFPLIYAHPPSTRASSRLDALTDGLVKPGTAPSTVCDELKAYKESLGFSDKMAMLTVTAMLGAAGWVNVLKVAGKNLAPLIDTVHGTLTGIGIEITSSISPAMTRLGGPDMHLAVGVFMHLHLPKVVVDCGWLAGLTFPGYGAVPGVKVSWGNGELASWGSFTCDGCDETGEDGMAHEAFTPGPEEVHNGPTIIERGDVIAYALVNFSMGNRLGFLGDVVRDQGHMIWELRHHKTGFPTGLTAEVHSVNGGSGPGVTADLTVTAVPDTSAPNCKSSKAVTCIYNVKDVSGRVTSTAAETTCTVNVPPVNALEKDSISADYLGLVDFGLDFYTAPLSKPCSVPVGISVNGLSQIYKYGETDTLVHLQGLKAGSDNGGTALIHWQY